MLISMGRLFNIRFLVVLSVILLITNSAFAKVSKRQATSDFSMSERYAALVINSKSGEVLFQKNADRKLYPASLTKMMTVYVTFHKLRDGKLSLADRITVSHKAASMERTNMNLKPGQKISVRDAIYAVIIHSANDAAVALAEAISGNETAFAYEMNKYAKALGMNSSNFKNPNGLPDPEQVTSAYDMARLGIALKRDFPEYYPMFSRKSFTFNGRIYNTHNRVLTRYKYAEGIKTGFIRASGFNLVSSTHSPMGDLVGVVFGGPSAAARDNHMIQILDYGYKALAKKRGVSVAQTEATGEVVEGNEDGFDGGIDPVTSVADSASTDVFDKHLDKVALVNDDVLNSKSKVTNKPQTQNKVVKKAVKKTPPKATTKKAKKIAKTA